MACWLCGIEQGLRTNKLISASETPYECGIRRGLVGGFTLAERISAGRIAAFTPCDKHQTQLDEARALLTLTLDERN